MKVHEDFESVIDTYLAGGLSEEERRELERHAVDCPTCTSIREEAAEFHNWMKGKSYGDAPISGLEDRIIANLRASTHRRAPRVVRLMAGAAAVFVLIIIGGIFSKSDEALQVQRKLGASAEPGEVASGWGYESSGYMALPKEGAKSSTEVDKFAVGVGTLARQLESQLHQIGAWENEAHRARQALKDAAPKPAATPPPAEKSQADAERSDHNESGEELGSEMERKRPEGDTRAEVPFVDDRKIIRNAELHLEVEAYDKAYAKIGDITKAKKGFVAGASTTRLANGKIRATVTLRIPPEQFEETLAELGALGTVRHQAISTADVTKQYSDLSSRLKSKETLVERLKKVLMEGKGTVKELMEVEVQMGATIEQIESIKGELKYYDNLVGLSTITMQVFEKDLGLPFEYVQTLQSTIGVTSQDADAAYAAAQKTILDAGGQVAESRMTRANDDSASGFVKGKFDAEKFPAVRDSLKRLGHVDQDTVNQQQTGRGGKGDVKPGATVRKEQAVIDFTVNTPPIAVTRLAAITIESAKTETAYQEARKEVEAATGRILGGSLTDRKNGATAYVKAQIDEERFPGLVDKLKSLGTVKNATVKVEEPGSETGRAPMLRKKGEIVIEIASPPPLIPEESGIGKVLRETFTRSIAGLLWSVEKLFVGIALAGPWIVLAILVLLVWRRARRKAKPSEA